MDDINVKYNNLKNLLHNGDYTADELNKIKVKFLDLYYDLIQILINKKDRYYGYILINLDIKITFIEDVIAGVSIINKLPFVLTINPLLILEFNLKQILFILCHEVEHLVLMHPTEVIKRNPSKIRQKTLLLNYAMDASVNESLKRDIDCGFKLIEFPSSSVDANTIKEMANLNTINYEESFIYYYNFIKDLNIVKHINWGLSNSLAGGDFKFEYTDYELIRKFIENCLDGMSSKSRGNLPYYQKRNLEILFANSKINWKQILRQYVGNVPNDFKKTKMKLNRREMFRYDLSGRNLDHTLKLVLAIDTSGSMDLKSLNNIMNEVFNIVKSKKYEITLIEFDAQIHDVIKLKRKQNIKYYLNGGGGTSYEVVVNYVNKNKYYRDAILVWFTDGYGEVEINRPHVYKNLWVILNNNKLSVKNPYGRVMRLECL